VLYALLVRRHDMSSTRIKGTSIWWGGKRLAVVVVVGGLKVSVFVFSGDVAETMNGKSK
jgi:hypothetical protein